LVILRYLGNGRIPALPLVYWKVAVMGQMSCLKGMEVRRARISVRFVTRGKKAGDCISEKLVFVLIAFMS